MKLEVIPADRLTDQEFHALRRLTLGRKRGELFDALEDWRYEPETKVIRLTDDDGRILSWGLVHVYDARGNKDFQIYTRASERRKGYGKMVYDKAVQVCRGRASMIVHPHSDPSTAYFNKLHYVPQGIPAMRLPSQLEKEKNDKAQDDSARGGIVRRPTR